MRIIASIALVLSFVAITAGEAYKCDSDAQTCINKIVQKTAQRGWIGVELDHEGEFLKVKAVIPGSPAAMAGLQAGDEIQAIQGVATNKEHQAELEKTFGAMKPGDKVMAAIVNSYGKSKVTLTLAKVPHEVAAKWLGGHMMAHAQAENVN